MPNSLNNVLLLSCDANMKSHCSLIMAQQLLKQGLVTIRQFYPYTIQFKKGKPFNPFEPTSEVIVSPKGPSNHVFCKTRNLEKVV